MAKREGQYIEEHEKARKRCYTLGGACLDDPDECPSMRLMRQQMEGAKGGEDNDKVYQGPGTVRMSDNTGTYAVGVDDAATMLNEFFLGAAAQCGDLFDMRDD